jgi:hypothetical protein
MELSMLESALHALAAIAEPTRLMFLALGAFLGLALGILPGIGGVAGTAILIPFTFGMDPYTAFAFLLGLASTTATGDPIPAVLFGVPGGAGSAATVSRAVLRAAESAGVAVGSDGIESRDPVLCLQCFKSDTDSQRFGPRVAQASSARWRTPQRQKKQREHS